MTENRRADGRRAALYMRVSTLGQTNENQRAPLVQMAQARGLEIVAVFEEKVSSAKHRPAFERMRIAAHAGKFDVLLIVALDRLSRSLHGSMQTILELDALGVEVVSLRESWLQMGGPVRGLLVAIFGWINEQYRLDLVSRTKAGLERARRSGKVIGRPRVQVDLSEARSLLARMPMAKASRKLGIGESTLRRLLKTEGALVQHALKTGTGEAYPQPSEITGIEAA